MSRTRPSTALPSVAVTADGTIGVLYDTFDGNSPPPGNFPRSAPTWPSAPTTARRSTTRCSSSSSRRRSTTGHARQRVLGDFQQIKADGDLLYGVFSGNRVPLNGGTGTSIIDPIYFSADTGISATGGFTVNATEGLPSSSQTVGDLHRPRHHRDRRRVLGHDRLGRRLDSAGTITGPTGGPFTVTGSHTYAEEGRYTINGHDHGRRQRRQHRDGELDGQRR